MALASHAVHTLYQYRKSISTTSYTARGKNLVRCQQCLLGQQFCTCEHRRQLLSDASFLLLMYDDEVLKPTNSGRLIADLIPDTHAFIWSRTAPDPRLLALLNDEQYQAYLVFPGEYANPGQPVVSHISAQRRDINKRLLLIVIDGSWREAIKIFRKSPYLQHLPMLSFDANEVAKYALRKGSRDFQFGTAEVAAMALNAIDEPDNGLALSYWFDLFIESSLLGRNRRERSSLTPIASFVDRFSSAHETAILKKLSQ